MAQQVILARRPAELPLESDFEVQPSHLRDLKQGDVQLDTILLSIDPYIRPIIGKSSSVGQVVPGSGLALVSASRSGRYREGELVRHRAGLRDRVICPDSDVLPFEAHAGLPLSTQVHALGGIGLCAYGGLIGTGNMQPGEQVLVSAAAGAVGSLAVQIARLKGCRVVGTASSPEKADWILRELGADGAISYQKEDVAEALRREMPKGIDIYFDNVGGDHLDAALPLMNRYGRIPVCGMISSYGDSKPGVKNLAEIIYRRVRITGFGFDEFDDLKDRFREEMAFWIASGQLKFFQTEIEGFDRIPAAIAGLFSGKNLGKMLVRLARDPAA